MRLLITGGPKTGKTTYSQNYPNVRHTDDLMRLLWSTQSDQISHWLDQPAPWVIEGVAIPRALRKWLKRNATGSPCDHLIYLTEPRIPRTLSQQALDKATWTIWQGIEPALRARGVVIQFGK